MNIKYYINNFKKSDKYINEFNKFSNFVSKVKTWEEANIIIEDIIYIKDENIIYDKKCYNIIKKNNFENKTILFYDHNKKINENFVPFYTEFIFNDNDSYENLIEKINNYFKINNDNFDKTFILKKKYGGRGTGTFLIKYDNDFYNNIEYNHKNYNEYKYLSKMIQININDIKNTYIVQKYIENPYLKDGKKSDLAVHFIIVKYDNKIYLFLHDNIIFRSTKVDYDINNLDIKIHLTNVAIQGINVKLLDNEIKDINDVNKIKKNVKKNVNDFCNSNKFKELLEKLKNNNKCFNFCYMTRIDLVLTNELETFIIEINDYIIGLEYLYDYKYIKKLKVNPILFTVEISNIILNNKNITEDIIKKHNFTQIKINKDKNKNINKYIKKLYKIKEINNNIINYKLKKVENGNIINNIKYLSDDYKKISYDYKCYMYTYNDNIKIKLYTDKEDNILNNEIKKINIILNYYKNLNEYKIIKDNDWNNNLSIHIYFIKYNKILKKNLIFDDINSGITIKNDIIIFKEEEYKKVLIHELIHFYNKDLKKLYKYNNKNIKIISDINFLDNTININESYVECITFIIYLILISENINDLKKKNYFRIRLFLFKNC